MFTLRSFNILSVLEVAVLILVCVMFSEGEVAFDALIMGSTPGRMRVKGKDTPKFPLEPSPNPEDPQPNKDVLVPGTDIVAIYHFPFVLSSYTSGVLGSILANKMGIYIWRNKDTGDLYVGSSVNLRVRISRYCHLNTYTTSVSSLSMRIIRGINAHPNGIHGFELYIIQFTMVKELVLQLEQQMLDKLFALSDRLIAAAQSGAEVVVFHIYNICKTAGSTLNRFHSEETKDLLSSKRMGQKRSVKTNQLHSQSVMGANNSFFGHVYTAEETAAIGATMSGKRFLNDPGVQALVSGPNMPTVWCSSVSWAMELFKLPSSGIYGPKGAIKAAQSTGQEASAVVGRTGLRLTVLPVANCYYKKLDMVRDTFLTEEELKAMLAALDKEKSLARARSSAMTKARNARNYALKRGGDDGSSGTT